MSLTYQERLDLLDKHLNSLTRDEFYLKFYGYSENEYEQYLECDFKLELDSIIELMHNGYLDDEDIPPVSNKFYRAFKDLSVQSELDEVFPTEVFYIEKYNIRMICVYGQGTLTSFELQ